jgi:hypothetical protein
VLCILGNSTLVGCRPERYWENKSQNLVLALVPYLGVRNLLV